MTRTSTSKRSSTGNPGYMCSWWAKTTPSTDTYMVEKRQSTGHKRTYVRLPGHTALRFGALALIAAVIAFVAFRGSTSNAKDTSDTDPRVFAGKFLSTGFGVLIG